MIIHTCATRTSRLPYLQVMKLFRVASTVLSLFAYGCGVGINTAAQPYIGKNISTVVSKLGYPSEKREMLGHTIYTWKTGNANQMYCNLDLGVDENNIITSGNWDGTNGGCMALAARLRYLSRFSFGPKAQLSGLPSGLIRRPLASSSGLGCPNEPDVATCALPTLKMALAGRSDGRPAERKPPPGLLELRRVATLVQRALQYPRPHEPAHSHRFPLCGV